MTETLATVPTIPAWIYPVAGALILGNLGTIGSVLFATYRLVWWASKVDSRIDQTKETAIRAHKRIDSVETRVNQRGNHGI